LQEEKYNISFIFLKNPLTINKMLIIIEL
jgi:hypothetical protein